MTRILVTGSNGQLGHEFRAVGKAAGDMEFLFTDIEELDLCDEVTVDTFIQKENPDFIINCAAYTAVDKAEEEEEKARAINATAVKYLSLAANRSDSYLIHISTDFVFDGRKSFPYTEEDPVNPLSVYARTKAEGEMEFLAHCRQGCIIRTSWLYSTHGHNFLKTIHRLSRERDELRVINDQVGTPTYAADLSAAIMQMLPTVRNEQNHRIYHYSNDGVCSWYDFARSIVNHNRSGCKVVPIGTEGYPLPAKRPSYSAMDHSRIEKTFGILVPPWEESVKRCLDKLMKDEK